MASYSSRPVSVPMSTEALAEKFSDFRNMQAKLDELPADERARVGEVSFTNDSIVISTQQVGDIVLRATERSPRQITLTAEGSPVPMSIRIEMNPLSADSTEVTGVMDVEIPAMIKPLVGPALQKAVDQFGNLFASLA